MVLPTEINGGDLAGVFALLASDKVSELFLFQTKCFNPI